MLHCDLRVRWKVASDLRFRAAISEPKTPSFCGISGDLAPSTRKSLAIAIVRFWCAKFRSSEGREWGVRSVVVQFDAFGAPRFSVQRSQMTYFKRFWDLWSENRGAPKTQNSTTTDLTPSLGPLRSNSRSLVLDKALERTLPTPAEPS